MLNNNYHIHDEAENNKNKKQDIVVELHTWFPWKTVQEVSDLYDVLVVEMLCEENGYGGANGIQGNISSMDSLVNSNFGVLEEKADNIYGDGYYGFGCPPDGMKVMETRKEVPMGEEDKVNIGKNKMPIHQQVATPYSTRFWTVEEHKLFLHGLRVFGNGRGRWKNISKYFVTTRTAVQVSSHAQKYFKRLERKGLQRMRHSINDVELDDADLRAMGISFPIKNAITSADKNTHNPSSQLQTPSVPSAAHPELPYPEKVMQMPAWSDKNVMVPMETPVAGPSCLFSYQ
ncbi:hypothetical protein QYE76_003890 [Lolium multiflorum]|uniref:Uncharacterized protein n=1 Tax=Lolium multiflorum TaxID=4521 RepID=A0AAD8RR71_LOLMU|nr:hypothetical protein QYE76_003890 [Lolium multiflorum]